MDPQQRAVWFVEKWGGEQLIGLNRQGIGSRSGIYNHAIEPSGFIKVEISLRIVQLLQRPRNVELKQTPKTLMSLVTAGPIPNIFASSIF
jgi:hypothetical protein